MNDIIDWQDEFLDLIRCIGSITYGKERWFYKGNGIWYDRMHCDEIPQGKMFLRVVEAVREAEEEE